MSSEFTDRFLAFLEKEATDRVIADDSDDDQNTKFTVAFEEIDGEMKSVMEYVFAELDKERDELDAKRKQE